MDKRDAVTRLVYALLLAFVFCVERIIADFGDGGGEEDGGDTGGGGLPMMSAMEKITTASGYGGRKQRVHHHKRHLSRSSSSSAAVHYPPGNALINELGSPDNMFVTENGTVVTSQIGGSAILPCATAKLGTATVSWIRRIDYTILTIGTRSYSSDKRFYVDHTRHLKTWNLEITPVEATDAGLYECRIATHPTTSNFVHLKVTEARAEILGAPDLYIMSGSSLRLVCRLQGSTQAPLFVFWYHSDRMINFDTDRGLIVHINSTESDLIMPYTNTSDSGNYTCQPQNIPPATIHVHVLQSEVPAAMQHGVRSSTSGSFAISNCAMFTIIYMLLQMLS
ncbi:hemicentin-2-like isoform X2 [Sipha flava]|nr:hemicentin-2-like isoform X2 [Sipha flava]XP_025406631.1 hemicentin-2-like isoform X2 [Sipha flava]XP_025406632.1 hemicentin-2-like isoform X2 [Sipha flava]XP_025406633.1 hemicentin-2-like isoform X2 [Sipha flava]XP_025406634.1 hemicentin-2-like isoform X2 [Sipha flava]